MAVRRAGGSEGGPSVDRYHRPHLGEDVVPRVASIGPYRFHFFANERGEPPHVHVERDDSEAKFWLDPVELAANEGFRAHELGRIRAIVIENRERFLEVWHGFFGR
jgi:Domain of unknown function (DUF4160)